MKKNFFFILIICLVFCSFAVSGCAKRVRIATIKKERVDQDASSGNKGFIWGTKPPQDEADKPAQPQMRRIVQVTLALPPYPEWKNFRFKPTEDKELRGNRGYIFGGPQVISTQPQKKVEPAGEISLPREERTPRIRTQKAVPQPERKEAPRLYVPPVQESYTMYVVQNGDTLQKISEKVYGTAKKWKKIYDYNSDVLKNPNKIYPGQKIKIPQL
ncbi:MAG: LysM peptidoglycan-binding domain-containing protein [Candidatus Omnitrophica bacterium]|nr:LysM peptidoglycan-binding domain-containing protein [Candidatus Omnitrophota bacterium]MBU4477692.1 LysM peptidoglycan-binding domain-containing protein [Candidatus Omnitrophota bacterium]MCG2703889.1 LysM peptidoglycan-binding domain-containing protein [Candidatus Omnitrophota bacterium]